MEKNVKNPDNTGIYMEHGEFYIGEKFYLVNPLRVRSVCYDDTPNEEKIILDFNHPDSKLEYYCMDGLQLEWKRIKRDFIKFWGTNIRDMEKFIADQKELHGENATLEPALSDIKTCRVYFPSDNDGKPHVYTKSQWEAEEKGRLNREKKFYEEQYLRRKKALEKGREEGNISEEKYQNELKYLEEKYKLLGTYEEDHKIHLNWDGIDQIIESDTLT